MEGSEFKMEADAVIMALGTSPNPMSLSLIHIWSWDRPGIRRRSAGCSTSRSSGTSFDEPGPGAGRREKLQQLGQQDGGLPLLSGIKGFETVHRF